MLRPSTLAKLLALTLVPGFAGCPGDPDPGTTPDADTDTDTDTDADADTDTDTDTDTDVPPVEATAVDPAIVDPLGGSHLTIVGAGFARDGDRHGEVVGVRIGGVAVASFVVVSDTELQVVSSPVGSASGVEVVVDRGDSAATLVAAVDVWSPAELAGARLFDAAHGVGTEEESASYEWQRLTAEIDPGWDPRDGNNLVWLPAEERFFLIAGWDPYGFDGGADVTTDQVWSSADGVRWRQDLAHGNGAFEPRHSANTVLWNDALWMIGGDTWQGYYNHDVVSSVDGVNWTVELGPGTTDPPWSERALQTIGVYDGKLWMAGGQDLLGDPADYVFHNDVWSTEDGVHWTEVAADAPASDTRWAGCGVLDGLVEFKGELWLVGCAREREDAVGHSMSNEVWSTTDGVTWTRHADPPWVGKIWPNVVVWDDKLWILFGYTYGDPANGWSAGNANEAWYSDDGETWRSLRPDAPVPGSHAQGVAVTEDHLVLAGGNYTFGFGAGLDRSVWQLARFHGEVVRTWTDRGADALGLTATDDEARPLLVDDAFAPGVPGLQFDGSTSVLALEGVDEQPAGRSVFWVARASYLPLPWAWEELYAPLGTIVGGPVLYGSLPNASVGLSGGQVVSLNLDDTLGAYGEFVWTRAAGGEGLQDEGAGSVRFAGLSHGVDGAVQVWVDGAAAGEPTPGQDYSTARGWSRLGGSFDDTYYGPNTRFAGTLGAVIVLPEAVDAATAARIHDWARGRFLVP